MPADVLAAARRICRDAFAADVTLSRSDVLIDEDWARHRVVRYRVESENAAHPSSVIVKQSNRRGGHIVREWAALEFLNTLDVRPRCTPRFIGGDADLELLVLSDLGDLDDVKLKAMLAGTDPEAAEKALIAASDRLGRLNSVAMSRLDDYERIRARLPVAAPLDFHQHGDVTDILDRTGILVAPAEISLTTAARDELDHMQHLLFQDSSFRTLVHGDVCPSNIAAPGGELWLLDFEVSGPGCALLDGAFTRLRHLNCVDGWRLPDEVRHRMQAAYRAGLCEHCPAARDDSAFADALAASCFAWTAITLQKLDRVWDSDKPRGEVSWRQRIISSLKALADVLAESTGFPALLDLVGQLDQRLHRQWSDQADLEAPLAPAFRVTAPE